MQLYSIVFWCSHIYVCSSSIFCLHALNITLTCKTQGITKSGNLQLVYYDQCFKNRNRYRNRSRVQPEPVINWSNWFQ
jgi:hypothetical protein